MVFFFLSRIISPFTHTLLSFFLNCLKRSFKRNRFFTASPPFPFIIYDILLDLCWLLLNAKKWHKGHTHTHTLDSFFFMDTVGIIIIIIGRIPPRLSA